MEFVYDRTESDITNKTAKGYANYADMNRLETNVKTISDYFSLPFTQKTYDVLSKPRQADYERIRLGIEAIKTAYNVSQVATPTRPFTTWQKWNDLEKLLYDTDRIFTENEANQPYCGEFYCGEYGLV